VIRSEADEIMFRHAEESGAKVFDGVKVSSIDFDSSVVESNGESSLPNIGRPVRASWSSKAGGSGTINFDYVVDASGRAGLLSTKYLKNRSYSKALKNVANWAYFSGAGMYGKETNRAGVPFFEALRGKTSYLKPRLAGVNKDKTKVAGLGSSLSTTGPTRSASS